MGTTWSFLFDECLTIELPHALRGTHHYGLHVRDLGLLSASDREVTQAALAADHVMVTNNGRDYRRIYQTLDLHPGLVVVVPRAPREQQIELFLKVLAHLETMSDAVNKLVEIDEASTISVSDLPPPP